MKVNAIPGLNLTITIQVDGAGVAPSQTPQGPAAPKVPTEAVQRRLANLRPLNQIPLRKKSSVKHLNSDPYPSKVTHNDSPSPKGMAAKPRQGYYH